MKLNIYIKEKNITTLGPYNRFGIWVQGCFRNCEGCVAKLSHDPSAGSWIDTGALAWEIIVSDTEGLTISGGEPFLQAEALTELIRKVKKQKDIGVIIYTGYLLEELPEVKGAAELLELTDLLIDGPYVRELDDGKSLRGSSNQKIHPLSGRYVSSLDEYGTGERKTEIFVRSNTINIVGIPNKEAPQKIKQQNKGEDKKHE